MRIDFAAKALETGARLGSESMKEAYLVEGISDIFWWWLSWCFAKIFWPITTAFSWTIPIIAWQPSNGKTTSKELCIAVCFKQKFKTLADLSGISIITSECLDLCYGSNLSMNPIIEMERISKVNIQRSFVDIAERYAWIYPRIFGKKLHLEEWRGPWSVLKTQRRSSSTRWLLWNGSTVFINFPQDPDFVKHDQSRCPTPRFCIRQSGRFLRSGI